MVNFEEYLSMSKHNPRFVHDFKYLLHTLAVLATEGKIEESERRRIYHRLCSTYDGEKTEGLNKAFERMNSLIKEGFTHLSFSEKGLGDFLAARDSCVKFFSWVDVKNHRPDNPMIHKYLTNLCNRLIDLAKESKEEFWDCYEELRTACRTSVARGLVSRARMDSYAKVLLHAMLHEYKIKQSLVKKDVTYLNIFDTEVKEEGFDLDLNIVNLTNLFITNLNQFNEAAKMAHESLFALRQKGVIDDNHYTRSNGILSSYTSTIQSVGRASLHDPLVVYNLCERKGDFGPLYLFDDKQVTKAAEYGRTIVRTFTNEFLINQLVGGILAEDVRKLGDSEVLKSRLLALLKENLELLKDFDIISLQQYVQYYEAGKEKFS